MPGTSLKESVIEAVNRSFHPRELDPSLTTKGDRVFGFVKVEGSQVFDDLDDARRQSLLWKALFEILGEEAFKVGPIVLEPSKRG